MPAVRLSLRRTRARNGLQVPVLAESTQAALRALLPPTASVSNPVDMIASATPDEYRRVLEVVAADPAVDSVIAIFIPPLVTEPGAVASAIREAAARMSKPVLASFLGSQGLRPQLAPAPSFAFPEAAAIALAHVTRYGEWLRQPARSVALLEPGLADRVTAIVEPALADGPGWLSPGQCEALLDAAGIPVVRSRRAMTADAAVAAAKAAGFPVVLKAAVGKDILHKSEVGGVRLGVASDQAVRDAFAALTSHLGDRLDGVLVQPMVSGAIEMVVGGVNDPAFGPVVMCGMGGVLVDILDDTAFALCPLGEPGARALIDRVKGRVRLRGFRGGVAADEAAFRALLVRASQLLHACPDIQELDLNPSWRCRQAQWPPMSIRVGRRAPTSRRRSVKVTIMITLQNIPAVRFQRCSGGRALRARARAPMRRASPMVRSMTMPWAAEGVRADAEHRAVAKQAEERSRWCPRIAAASLARGGLAHPEISGSPSRTAST